MDQAGLSYCLHCKNKKPIDQFILRKKDDKYGLQGEPTSSCTSCATKAQQRRDMKKRKWVEEGIHLSGDPAEANCPTSLEQFAALLHKQALTGDICYSARVSIQGLSREEDEIFTAIVGHVWEATRFWFMYGQFLHEGQWLMLPFFNQIQNKKCPEEWYCPASL